MKLNKLIAQSLTKTNDAIPTGLESLDQMIGGLHPGHIYTIAGRPGMGCSAFTVTLARNISILGKVPTAFFSLDIPEDNIVKRLFAAEYGWNTHPSEIYALSEELGKKIPTEKNTAPSIQKTSSSKELERAKAMMEKNGWDSKFDNDLGKTSHQPRKNYIQLMKEAPLWIEHNLDFTVEEILCRIERMKKSDNIRVVIIDGLWWLIASKTFVERDLLMQKIAQSAKKMNIAILLTTVLNREVEARGGDKRPMLSDIRGGLCSEVYSSVIMMLYRAEYYGITEDWDGNSTREMLEVIVVKNAFGKRGEIKLRFSGTASIEECEPSSIEDDLQDLSKKLRYLDDFDYPF